MVDPEVHLWLGVGTDPAFLVGAKNAVEELANQTSGGAIFWVDQSDKPDFDAPDTDDWSTILHDFADHVEAYHSQPPGDNEYHMLLINRAFSLDGVLGAGVTAGGSLGEADGSDYWWPSSKAVLGATNVTVKAYVNNYGCYNYEGTTAYEATVMHEVGHGITDYTYGSSWDDLDDSCDSEDHALGGIDANDEVTPMQLWYTALTCDNNPSVCDNCTSNAWKAPNGITRDLSSCTKEVIDAYLSNVTV